MVSENLFSTNKRSETVIIPEITYDQRTMEPRVRHRTVIHERDSVQPVSISEQDILVVRNMGLGDVLMSLVAVRALRKRHPKAHIRFACNPEYIDVVSRTPYIDEVLPIEKAIANPDEQVLDLRMCVEPYEIGGKISKELYDSKNRIDIFLETVGLPGQDQKIEIFLRSQDVSWAAKMVRSWPVGGRTLLGIQAFCSSLYRSWPEEYFRKFVSLVDKEKYLVVILGEKCLWPWASYEIEGEGIINMLGKTTAAQACAMVGQMGVFVGIDSGLMHVAAALGVKSVALFAAIAPDLRLRYYPTVKAVTPSTKLVCGPCGDIGASMHPECPVPSEVKRFAEKKTVGAPCMKEIYPENVLAVVETNDAKCLLCGGAAGLFGCKNGYALMRCLGCGFVFSNRWSEAEAHAIYADRKYWEDEAHLERESPVNNKTRIRRLSEWVDMSGKRILDAGCGQGGFVRYLNKNGFSACGIDLAVSHNEECFEVKSIFDEERTFDIVASIEVIEHVYNPRALFKKFSEMVCPGGLLYLESSDTDKAISHKRLGLGNDWFNPPIHCVSYDWRSLNAILLLYGFEVIKDFSQDGGYFSLIVLARRK